MSTATRNEPILTVPEVLDEVAPVQPTGSTWVTLPDIDAATGAVPSLTVLHERAGGLIEVTGSPLVAARVTVDGHAVADDAWRAGVVSGLLPTWHAEVAGCRVVLTIACPPHQRGVVVELTAERVPGTAQRVPGTAQRVPGATRPPGADRAVPVALELHGSCSGAALHVFSSRPLEGPHRCRFDPWSRALVWELGAGLPVVGLAVRAADGAAPMLEGTGLATRWSHRREAELAAGAGTALTVLLGVGREADSASLATVDLARRGGGSSIEATRRWMDARRGPELGPERAALQQVRDRNRLFCATFAAGRTIDTDELVLVTSRSPRYYVSGAHWTRDSLLWAFPAVLAVDPAEAVAWVRTALTHYAKHPGDHALSITGGSLYPGFELDQVCAFHLAVDALAAVDPDATAALLREPEPAAGLARVDAALDGARDPGTGLYATFLLSSDDPAPLPFVTYSNALAVAALRARERSRALSGGRPSGDGPHARAEDAEQLLAAIDRHLVVDGPFGPMFAGAGDGAGNHVLFDEPPGSLELLAHRGVVTRDDPRWLATVEWIHSTHNPHGPGSGRFATPTCPHAEHPWLLSMGNALLRGEDRWLELLPGIAMDNGLACETVDAHTGTPRTGLGFATCAGWLAHAIDVATARARGTGAGDGTGHDDGS